MSESHKFLAIDLGAESGRGIIVTLKNGKVAMEEINRFQNRRITLAGTMYWDIPSLFAEILSAIRICTDRNVKLSGISVDTWGVDFGLLGSDGKLLGNCVSYRDTRTENIHAYSDKLMPTDEIFTLTAYEPWAISSLFQLAAMQRDNSPQLGAAETFLNIPDLLLYFLTGEKKSEMSIANTSNLMGVDCKWSQPIIDAFNLPDMFAPLVEPATVVGTLCEDVQRQTGADPDVPVIATCGHDTSAVAAAIPAEGDNWAFISCGTWSVLGAMIDEPAATPQCRQLGFTNEYTVGGWYLGCNILGLWLVQELRRKWDTPDDPWDYNRITAAAAAATSGPLFDVAHESLMSPPDMEDAILTLLKSSGQNAPADRGALVLCVLKSLALEYAFRLDALGQLKSQTPDSLYIVGGGTQNKLLCQFTADACGLSTHAGADQCTAMGNALTQALAVGILKDKQQIRDVMRNSTATVLYHPENQPAWAEKRQRYAALKS
ncbi:MAG: rhamnulokinase [Phycisphaerae bacterium]|nr:rhamnulokinase [Phycisphaerae bacterium]